METLPDFIQQSFALRNTAGPALLNEAASSTNSTLVPNFADDDTGIGGNGSTALYAITGGTSVMEFQAGQAKVTGNFLASNAAGPGFLDEAATATNPTLTPNRADDDTGIGWVSANKPSFIAGGSSVFSVTSGVIRPASGIDIIGDLSNSARIYFSRTASSTVPVFCPSAADTNTGIGRNAADDLSLITGGTETIRCEPTQISFQTTAQCAGRLQFQEISAPTGAANFVMLYADDSGGKTRLMVVFGDNVPQVIASEP